jgi:hypothetical protein
MATKKGRWRGMMLAGGVFMLAIWLSPALWAQAPREQPPGVIPPGMLKAYGSSVTQGEYEGTLYCLPHDFSQDKKDQDICTKEGRHHHALMMADGHVHPLYGDTEELNKQLNAADMNAKKVKIRGKYYPVSNAILVTAITPVGK